MAEVAAVVPVTQEQVKNLASLDAWLSSGPKYVRNAAIGAAAGAAVAMFMKKKAGKKGALKGAAAGAAATAVGGFLFFQLGKWASRVEHQHLALAHPIPHSPVVTKGAFAGAPRTLYPTVDAHEVYR